MSWITNGTIAVANASPDVTGASTTWADDKVLPGDLLVAPDGSLQEILSVTDNTHLTLTVDYPGSGSSAQAYQIIPMTAASSQDVYAKIVEMLSVLRNDLNIAGVKAGTPVVDDAVLATRGDKVSFEAAGALLAQFSKGSAGDVLSLVLASALSGRAKFDLEASSNDLVLSVSTDGSGWTECMRVANDTGVITLSVDMYDRLGVVINGGTGGGGGAGGSTWNPTGTYNPATTYGKGDAVSYQSGSYISIVDDNLNKTPNLQPSFWQIIAVQGAAGGNGTNGWSQVIAIEEDGDRRVQKVVDWVGGTGPKPATGFYVTNVGYSPDVEDATDLAGPEGDPGPAAWTPELAVVEDGDRRVQQIIDWSGGEGTKPDTGKYLGASGPVDDIGDATDVRGDDGPPGDASTVPGPAGPATGIGYAFSTTITDADPGAGKLRMNNVDPTAATVLFMDLQSADGFDVTAWLDGLDNSTNTVKGHVHVINADDPAQHHIYSITGSVTTATGYRKVPVAFLSGSTGLMANAATLTVAAYQAGDKGTDGAGAGTITGGTNLGGGYQVFKDASGANLRYKSIVSDAAVLGMSDNGTELHFTLSDSLKALGALTGVAGQFPYFTSATAASLAQISANALSLLAAANYTDMKTLLGLATVATTGEYSDLSGKPTLGTAAAASAGDFATPSDITTVNAAIALKENIGELTGMVTKTASYTPVLGEKGYLFRMNVASANNFTVPTNASVAYPIKTVLVVRQVGAGATTVVAASGVTINFPGARDQISERYGAIQLTKVDTNTWDVDGAMT